MSLIGFNKSGKWLLHFHPGNLRMHIKSFVKSLNGRHVPQNKETNDIHFHQANIVQVTVNIVLK
jgi:hypothetical protein